MANKLEDELLFQRSTQIYLLAFSLIKKAGTKYGSQRVFGVVYCVRGSADAPKDPP
jgi:hypothetical protein